MLWDNLDLLARHYPNINRIEGLIMFHKTEIESNETKIKSTPSGGTYDQVVGTGLRAINQMADIALYLVGDKLHAQGLTMANVLLNKTHFLTCTTEEMLLNPEQSTSDIFISVASSFITDCIIEAVSAEIIVPLTVLTYMSDYVPVNNATNNYYLKRLDELHQSDYPDVLKWEMEDALVESLSAQPSMILAGAKLLKEGAEEVVTNVIKYFVVGSNKKTEANSKGSKQNLDREAHSIVNHITATGSKEFLKGGGSFLVGIKFQDNVIRDEFYKKIGGQLKSSNNNLKKGNNSSSSVPHVAVKPGAQITQSGETAKSMGRLADIIISRLDNNMKKPFIFDSKPGVNTPLASPAPGVSPNLSRNAHRGAKPSEGEKLNPGSSIGVGVGAKVNTRKVKNDNSNKLVGTKQTELGVRKFKVKLSPTAALSAAVPDSDNNPPPKAQIQPSEQSVPIIEPIEPPEISAQSEPDNDSIKQFLNAASVNHERLEIISESELKTDRINLEFFTETGLQFLLKMAEILRQCQTLNNNKDELIRLKKQVVAEASDRIDDIENILDKYSTENYSMSHLIDVLGRGIHKKVLSMRELRNEYQKIHVLLEMTQKNIEDAVSNQHHYRNAIDQIRKNHDATLQSLKQYKLSSGQTYLAVAGLLGCLSLGGPVAIGLSIAETVTCILIGSHQNRQRKIVEEKQRLLEIYGNTLNLYLQLDQLNEADRVHNIATILQLNNTIISRQGISDPNEVMKAYSDAIDTLKQANEDLNKRIERNKTSLKDNEDDIAYFGDKVRRKRPDLKQNLAHRDQAIAGAENNKYAIETDKKQIDSNNIAINNYAEEQKERSITFDLENYYYQKLTDIEEAGVAHLKPADLKPGEIPSDEYIQKKDHHDKALKELHDNNAKQKVISEAYRTFLSFDADRREAVNGVLMALKGVSSPLAQLGYTRSTVAVDLLTQVDVLYNVVDIFVRFSLDDFSKHWSETKDLVDFGTKYGIPFVTQFVIPLLIGVGGLLNFVNLTKNIISPQQDMMTVVVKKLQQLQVVLQKGFNEAAQNFADIKSMQNHLQSMLNNIGYYIETAESLVLLREVNEAHNAVAAIDDSYNIEQKLTYIQQNTDNYSVLFENPNSGQFSRKEFLATLSSLNKVVLQEAKEQSADFSNAQALQPRYLMIAKRPSNYLGYLAQKTKFDSTEIVNIDIFCTVAHIQVQYVQLAKQYFNDNKSKYLDDIEKLQADIKQNLGLAQYKQNLLMHGTQTLNFLRYIKTTKWLKTIFTEMKKHHEEMIKQRAIVTAAQPQEVELQMQGYLEEILPTLVNVEEWKGALLGKENFVGLFKFNITCKALQAGRGFVLNTKDDYGLKVLPDNENSRKECDGLIPSVIMVSHNKSRFNNLPFFIQVPQVANGIDNENYRRSPQRVNFIADNDIVIEANYYSLTVPDKSVTHIEDQEVCTVVTHAKTYLYGSEVSPQKLKAVKSNEQILQADPSWGNTMYSLFGEANNYNTYNQFTSAAISHYFDLINLAQGRKKFPTHNNLILYPLIFSATLNNYINQKKPPEKMDNKKIFQSIMFNSPIVIIPSNSVHLIPLMISETYFKDLLKLPEVFEFLEILKDCEFVSERVCYEFVLNSSHESNQQTYDLVIKIQAYSHERRQTFDCLKFVIARFDSPTINAYQKINSRADIAETRPNLNEFLIMVTGHLGMYGIIPGADSIVLSEPNLVCPVELPFSGLLRILSKFPARCFKYDHKLYNEASFVAFENVLDGNNDENEQKLLEKFFRPLKAEYCHEYLQLINLCSEQHKRRFTKLHEQLLKTDVYNIAYKEFYKNYEVVVAAIRLVTNWDEQFVIDLLKRDFRIIPQSWQDALLKQNLNLIDFNIPSDEALKSFESLVAKSSSSLEKRLFEYLTAVTNLSLDLNNVSSSAKMHVPYPKFQIEPVNTRTKHTNDSIVAAAAGSSSAATTKSPIIRDDLKEQTPANALPYTITLQDGRLVTFTLQKASGDGNCGFRSILGHIYLKKEKAALTRAGVIDLLKINANKDNDIRQLISVEIVAKYREWIGNVWNMDRDFPEKLSELFRLYKTRSENKRLSPQAQEELMQGLEEECLLDEIQTIYLDSYLSKDYIWPHIQGTLTAFATLIGVKLHCIHDEGNNKIRELTDINQPQREYEEEVFIFQNLARDHFDRAVVENTANLNQEKQKQQNGASQVPASIAPHSASFKLVAAKVARPLPPTPSPQCSVKSVSPGIK
jgi:hypothetical protein